MNIPIDIGHRDELPEFLNCAGLLGTGAEIGVQKGDYSETILKKWNGKALFSIDAWQEFPESEYVDISNLKERYHSMPKLRLDL